MRGNPVSTKRFFFALVRSSSRHGVRARQSDRPLPAALHERRQEVSLQLRFQFRVLASESPSLLFRGASFAPAARPDHSNSVAALLLFFVGKLSKVSSPVVLLFSS